MKRPPRLTWLDGVKGISILWIAFFHFFSAWNAERPSGPGFPSPLADDYLARVLAACPGCSPSTLLLHVVEYALAGTALLGWHAVAVFLVMSGFGLTYSLARTGEPAGGWIGWYKSRLLRLFPMYWVAHILYLVSPFQWQVEPIDYRFLLSFLGDRIWPLDSIFYYFNPALWYFGLLLELYLVFPLLFRLLQRLEVGAFLALAAAATFGGRYVLLCVWPVNGDWVQGGFFLGRLWEFALGMALGLLCRRDATELQRRLFAPVALVAGAGLYVLGLYSYGTLRTYVFADALIGTGLFVVLAHLARALDRLPSVGAALATVGAYSYGLYLIHQPYVLYFGGHMRPLETQVFVVAAFGILGMLTLAAMELERRVNALTS